MSPLTARDSHDSNQAAAQAPVIKATATPVTVTCPATVQHLRDGDDLPSVAATPGVTYELRAGTYTINATIALSTAGTTTCYRAASGAPPGSVKVLVNTQSTDESAGRAFVVSNGAFLGLQELLMDGQDSSLGVRVEGGSALDANGVILHRFYRTTAGAGGAAIRLSSAYGRLTNTTLVNNTCSNCFGGALETTFTSATGSLVELTNVIMTGNTAFNGGGVFIEGGNTLIWLGSNVLRGNSASNSGAAVFIGAGSSMVVSGQLCVQDNTDGDPLSGSLYVDANNGNDPDGQLLFTTSSQANLANNSPVGIYITSRGGKARCGDSSSPAWKAGGYTITGPACACNNAFVDGSSSTCGSCGPLGWSSPSCACAECAGGSCCDISTLSFKPAGEVCARSGNACQYDALCDGVGADCPGNPAKPFGLQCAWRPTLPARKPHKEHPIFHGRRPHTALLVEAPEDYEYTPWERCRGKCIHGVCAWAWPQPECCFYEAHTSKAATPAGRDSRELFCQTRGLKHTAAAGDKVGGGDGYTLYKEEM